MAVGPDQHRRRGGDIAQHRQLPSTGVPGIDELNATRPGGDVEGRGRIQVQQHRLGAVQDPELERIFAAAHQALYTAPSDLANAAQLVRRYQETLNGAARAPEVTR